MKKVRILSILVILVLILTSTVVFADDNTFVLELQPSATELKRGDTLNVKVVLKTDSTEKGIQGYQSNLGFDSTVFELQKNSTVLDAYTENGKYDATVSDSQILLTDNSLEKIAENAVTVTIPLKVKNDAKYGETSISISDILGSYIDFESAASSSSTGTSSPLTVNIVESKQEETVTLSKLQITEMPDKVDYKVGEKFDPKGMEVEAIFSDNSSSTITDYTYEPTGELTLNDKEITVKYKVNNVEKQATLPITVSDGVIRVEVVKLNKIEVTTKPKTTYKVGEKFSSEGMVVEAIYTDGTRKAITDYTVSPTEALTESDKEITIKYKEDGIEKECKLSITVVNNEETKTGDDKQDDDNKQEEQKTSETPQTPQEGETTKTEETAKAEDTGKTESNNKIPQTGVPGIILPSIIGIGLVVVAIVCYKKYKNMI